MHHVKRREKTQKKERRERKRENQRISMRINPDALGFVDHIITTSTNNKKERIRD